MIDPKLIRSDIEKVKEKLRLRGADLAVLDSFVFADEKWRKQIVELETAKSNQNTITAEIAKMKRSGQDASTLLAQMKELSSKIKEMSDEASALEEYARKQLLQIPNLPADTTPAGKDSSANTEVRRWGQGKETAVPHNEAAEKLGIIDNGAGAKLSGARFTVYRGAGADLEMALINFMLDVHKKQHGYTHVMAPYLVGGHCLVGTGQLPKFEEDLYKTEDGMYLIPTAEVSVTNLHREELLPADKLPVKYVSYSACFRREAGSYGKDMKGIIRLHQFNKVELVKLSLPETSFDELESLTADAEKILQLLGLPYRVMALCSGDIGFSSAKTYDLEVWFPSEKGYKEISSCSNFQDFQARRANIRFKRDAKSKPEFVHTLNGSGLAVGRTLAAVIENYQNPDGSVTIPPALVPYMQADLIK